MLVKISYEVFMALYLMLTSAFFAAMQNLCMRRSVDTGGSTALYVPIQLIISCLLAVLINPVRTGNFAFDGPTVLLGLFMGLLLGVMMSTLGESLKYGSPALTFAVLNSCSVLPAVLMALLFGAKFGHPYHWWTGLGSALVIAGIFWSSWTALSCQNRRRWTLFIGAASLSFVIFSAMTQWRVLLETEGATNLLLPFKLDGAQGMWFMPALFFSAALVPLLKMKQEVSFSFSKETFIYGLLGGLCNGSSMYFMILAPQKAVGWQNAVLFPVFSIAVIEICNIWGRTLYKERINWVPQSLCVGGLILGSVYWPGIFN